MLREIPLIVAASLLALRGGAAADAGQPLTLEQALVEAEAANARLGVSRFEPRIAGQSLAQSRGSVGPAVSVGSALLATPPGADYGEGASAAQSNLQVLVQQPLYQGGALRGQIHADEATLRAARFRYKMDWRDVALDVRSRFSEVLADDQVVKAREAGLARLQTYLEFVRARKASGVAVELDLLRTRSRMQDEQASLADAQLASQQARMQVNVLLGREPTSPLVLAALPEPGAAAPQTAAAGEVPDVAAAAEQKAAADAQVQVAQAVRLPHVALVANAGLIDPGIGAVSTPAGTGNRLRDDLGAAFGVQLTWDLWHMGALSAQVEKARLVAAQADASLSQARAQAALSRERALADVRQRLSELTIRRDAVPTARDTYLVAESLYRGGTGSSLDVLDAYRALLDAQIALAQATLQARVAEATMLRWTPE